jgi:hypothetical protein
MRPPSFSIADMMVIVAFVALDCVLIRLANSGPALPYLIVGGSLMQIGLVIGLLLMFRRRRRMETPYPFLVGFEAVGWIGHLIYVVLCLRSAIWIDEHLRAILAPLLNATGFSRFSTPDMIWRFILGISCLTAPQLAIALVGGWINQRWWRQTHPEQAPTSESLPRGG